MRRISSIHSISPLAFVQNVSKRVIASDATPHPPPAACPGRHPCARCTCIKTSFGGGSIQRSLEGSEGMCRQFRRTWQGFLQFPSPSLPSPPSLPLSPSLSLSLPPSPSPSLRLSPSLSLSPPLSLSCPACWSVPACRLDQRLASERRSDASSGPASPTAHRPAPATHWLKSPGKTNMAVAQKTGTKMEPWQVEAWTKTCVTPPV